MFLIYMFTSFIVLFGGILTGSVTREIGQIWVLVTLSVGSITYALETARNGK